MISGDRVRQARELRGLTQSALAERLGVSQAEIALIENGRRSTHEALAEAIAFQVGFPPSFFRQETTVDFPFGSLQFRAHATATARERQVAWRWAQTIFELVEK